LSDNKSTSNNSLRFVNDIWMRDFAALPFFMQHEMLWNDLILNTLW